VGLSGSGLILPVAPSNMHQLAATALPPIIDKFSTTSQILETLRLQNGIGVVTLVTLVHREVYADDASCFGSDCCFRYSSLKVQVSSPPDQKNPAHHTLFFLWTNTPSDVCSRSRATEVTPLKLMPLPMDLDTNTGLSKPLCVHPLPRFALNRINLWNLCLKI